MLQHIETYTRARAAQQAAHNALLKAQPKPIQEYLAGLSKRYGEQAKALTKARAEQTRLIERQLEPHRRQIAKANQELDEARRNLDNIPLDCEPSDLATWAVVNEKWPARIGQLSADMAPLLEQQRTLDNQYDADMRRLQAELTLEIKAVLQAVSELTPNVYKLTE